MPCVLATNICTVATTLSLGACNAAWLELIEVRKRLEAVFDLYSPRLESPGVEFRAHVVQLQGKARTWGIRVGRTAQVEDDRQRASAIIQVKFDAQVRAGRGAAQQGEVWLFQAIKYVVGNPLELEVATLGRWNPAVEDVGTQLMLFVVRSISSTPLFSRPCRKRLNQRWPSCWRS